MRRALSKLEPISWNDWSGKLEKKLLELEYIWEEKKQPRLEICDMDEDRLQTESMVKDKSLMVKDFTSYESHKGPAPTPPQKEAATVGVFQSSASNAGQSKLEHSSA